VEGGYVRHQPDRLAQELILLHAGRSVRIVGTDQQGDVSRVEKWKK